MSSLLRPVGHLPASVYWFRRGLLLAVLVALVLVLLRVLGGGGDDPKAASSDVTSPSPTAASTSGTTPSAPASSTSTSGSPAPPTETPRCAGSDVTVGVIPAARIVGSGRPLAFGVVLGAIRDGCTAAVDPTRLTLTIMSGKDRIWTSGHCQKAITRASAILADGKDFTTGIRWDGRRSGPGCLPGQPVAKPGTYTAQASYDGRASAVQAFRIS